MSYRLLAMDMDGTVLNSEKIITPRTEAAIRAAIAAGKDVFFATGRSPMEVEKELSAFPEMRYAMFVSGAIVRDLKTGENIHSVHIPFPIVEKILDIGEKSRGFLAIYAGNNVYAEKKYPDMSLFLGNELGYFTDCKQHLKSGKCRLIGGRYLLVDFTMDATLFAMRHAVGELLRTGYPVILAHVERYAVLHGEFGLLNEWAECGAFLQVNAESLSKNMSFFQKRYIKKLFMRCPIHLVASDAHNLTDRPPSLAEAAGTLTEYFGQEGAEALLWKNPSLVLEGKRIG